MKRNRRLLVGMALIALSVIMISSTLGAWSVDTPSVHIINTGNLHGRLVEEYTPATGLAPGAVVDKYVNVENTGDFDMHARVKITKTWVDTKDEDGTIIEEGASLSAENIQLNLNFTNWLDGGDGWYYYKGIIKAKTKADDPPLMESFELIAEDTGNEYKRKTANIVVELECLQVGGGALEEVWERTYTELEITQPTPPPSATTYVTLENKDDFKFIPADTTDLFANFKNLVPGENRTQTIQVKNALDQAVTIRVKAEAIAQSLATPQNLALVEAMLREHATIVVTNTATGEVIYSGAVWGNYPNEPTAGMKDSMKNQISLGEFAPGASKDLTVRLTLSKDMENEFQDLWGLIQWHWYAEGEDSTTPKPTKKPGGGGGTPKPTRTPTPEYSPKSGDATLRGLWLSLLIVAGLVGVYLCIPKRKERDTV